MPNPDNIDREGVRVTFVRFVNAQPATADSYDNAPFVMLSLESHDSQLMDIGININDARDLVVDVLRCLAHFGDTKAEEVLDRHFRQSD